MKYNISIYPSTLHEQIEKRLKDITVNDELTINYATVDLPKLLNTYHQLYENGTLVNAILDSDYMIDNIKYDHVKIEGHTGKWYEIDRMKKGNTNYLLMEHETYGDEAACVIITEKTHKIILEDVYNGFDDLDN
jgi:hypothetical protein